MYEPLASSSDEDSDDPDDTDQLELYIIVHTVDIVSPVQLRQLTRSATAAVK